MPEEVEAPYSTTIYEIDVTNYTSRVLYRPPDPALHLWLMIPDPCDQSVLYVTGATWVGGLYRLDLNRCTATGTNDRGDGGSDAKGDALSPIRLESTTVDSVTPVPHPFPITGIEIIATTTGAGGDDGGGGGEVLLIVSEDCEKGNRHRIWLVNPRNGRLAVLINPSGEMGRADGDSLTAARLTLPRMLCALNSSDRDQTVLLAESRQMREITLPTVIDSRLF